MNKEEIYASICKIGEGVAQTRSYAFWMHKAAVDDEESGIMHAASYMQALEKLVQDADAKQEILANIKALFHG